MIKVILYSTMLVGSSLCSSIYAGELSKRLWRELNQAKYQDAEQKAHQQDMAWLEESLEKENSPAAKKEETVDQVMAEFNREQHQGDEDSISLKMAAPKRREDKGPSRSPALSPASRKELEDKPLTRQRSR